MRILIGLLATCSLVMLSIGCGGDTDDKNDKKAKDAPKEVKTDDGKAVDPSTATGDDKGGDDKGTDDNGSDDTGSDDNGSDDTSSTGTDVNADTADNATGGPTLDTPPLKDPTKTGGDS